MMMKWEKDGGRYTAVSRTGLRYFISKDSWTPSRPWRISVRQPGCEEKKTSSAFKTLAVAATFCESVDTLANGEA
jgi:hypothetical protein